MNKQIITIDFLILNLNGYLQRSKYDKETFFDNSPFSFELSERGTKIFSSNYTIYYNNHRFAVLLANPYTGSVLAPDFAQIQIENTFFYTHTLAELKSIIFEFLQCTGYTFKSVNRLDIALDAPDNNGKYKQLVNDLFTKKCLISGKRKKINFYTESDNGKIDITGFTVGKRNSSRFLRVYNKSLNLQDVPKDYITQWHKDNQLEGEIWRFEYQLNARFFDYLHKTVAVSDKVIDEQIGLNMFDVSALIKLIQIAEKNHFEIKENTGKSQVNKEKSIILNCWETVKSAYKAVETIVRKIPKILELTTVVKKRLAKSLLREYYITGQSLQYIISLNHLLQENDLETWFYSKMPYYMAEFHAKEKIKDTFNWETYDNHRQIFI